ncbi:MAG: glycosyltransferase family 4 protein [Bacteroidales bacterium]|nr:glycosyltransferase family 4 protein [Bacteroidales bacterium]
MRIAIEGQRLFRKKKHGMDFVALELIKNLQTIDKKNQYFVFVTPDEDKCLHDTENFKIIELKGGPYPTWEQIALPKAVKKYKCNVLQCTSNTAPINSPVPLIIILHDIIYMESIALFQKGYSSYQKLGNMYRRFVVPRVLKKAHKVITVSEFEKERIKNFFKLSENKIEAVYNGVGKHFKKIDEASVLSSIKKKYNLPDKYFFFLGNTDPKKNTKNVLKAYAQYVQQKGNEIKLLMLDYEESELQKLLTEINALEIRSDIFLAGYVVNSDLPAIYNMAGLFLYPSLRESFGIPMLEAMACGTAVVTSNTSSMPEVAGDSAKIIDPFQASEILNAMIELLENQDLKNQYIISGYERAKRFSWEAMAFKNLDIYETVFAESFEKGYESKSMLFI